MSAPLTPIPAEHPLGGAQWLVEISTGERFFACNCARVPPTRSLRYVQANRHLFALPPDVKAAPKPDTPKGAVR